MKVLLSSIRFDGQTHLPLISFFFRDAVTDAEGFCHFQQVNKIIVFTFLRGRKQKYRILDKKVAISSTFLRANFSYKRCFLAAFSSYVLALAKNLYKKRTGKTLMKLTERINFIIILHENLFHVKVICVDFL